MTRDRGIESRISVRARQASLIGKRKERLHAASLPINRLLDALIRDLDGAAHWQASTPLKPREGGVVSWPRFLSPRFPRRFDFGQDARERFDARPILRATMYREPGYTHRSQGRERGDGCKLHRIFYAGQ